MELREAYSKMEQPPTQVKMVNGRPEYGRPHPSRHHGLFTSAGFSIAHMTAPPGDFAGVSIQDFVSLTLTQGGLSHLDWDTGDGKRHQSSIEDGEQFLWLANRPLYACTADPLECLVLSLEPSFFTHAAQETVDPDSIEVLGQSRMRDPLAASIGHALHRQHTQHGVMDKIYGETLATSLAVHLLRTYTIRKHVVADIGSHLTRAEMRRAIEYIHAHLDTDLALSDIANAACLSPYYFARLFKLTTGHAPHQFVINARVEKAKSLLKYGKLSIAEVAQAVGFYDHAHFIRHFKRSVGVTPGVYREE